MAHDGQDMTMQTPTALDNLLTLTAAALPPVDAVLEKALSSVRKLVTVDDRVSAALIEQHQTAAHGLAWLATYAQALRQMQAGPNA